MSALLVIQLIPLWFYAVSVIPAILGYLVCAYGAVTAVHYAFTGRDLVIPMFEAM